MKRMNLTAFLLGGVCLLCQPLQAQQSIDACDGRTYKVGDTLRIGEPLPSGYLFVKQLNANNQFDKLDPKNSTGRIAIITDIPAYQPELYQQFGIYQQPETPQIVFAEQGDFKIGVYLNMALSKGNIMSGHHVSCMNGAVDLTPAVLFVYAHKLYGKPIDTASVETYASLRAPQQYTEAANDPFALEGLLGINDTWYKRRFGEITDFNEANNTGYMFVDKTQSLDNKPNTSSNYGFLETIAINEVTIKQTFVDFQSRFFIRICNNGTWTDWKQIQTT